MTFLRSDPTYLVAIDGQPIGVNVENVISTTSAIAASSYVIGMMKHDGTSVTSMHTNGAGASVKTFSFSTTVPTVLYRINAAILDGSSEPNEFGGVSSLQTGLRIVITDNANTVVKDFTADQAVQNNNDWHILAGTDMLITQGTSVDGVGVRWTFERAGAPLYLDSNHSFSVVVRDDLGALTSFRMQVQGKVA